jgi:hypothetical protein
MWQANPFTHQNTRCTFNNINYFTIEHYAKNRSTVNDILLNKIRIINTKKIKLMVPRQRDNKKRMRNKGRERERERERERKRGGKRERN